MQPRVTADVWLCFAAPPRGDPDAISYHHAILLPDAGSAWRSVRPRARAGSEGVGEPEPGLPPRSSPMGAVSLLSWQSRTRRSGAELHLSRLLRTAASRQRIADLHPARRDGAAPGLADRLGARHHRGAAPEFLG